MTQFESVRTVRTMHKRLERAEQLLKKACGRIDLWEAGWLITQSDTDLAEEIREFLNR